jgi:hypothetical protein
MKKNTLFALIVGVLLGGTLGVSYAATGDYPTQYFQRMAFLNLSQVYGDHGVTVVVTSTGTSAASASQPAGMYRIVADGAGYLLLGGTADSADAYVPANSPEAIRLDAATTFNWISASGTTHLHVTPLSAPTSKVP